MSQDNGYEISSLNPGWIKKEIPKEFIDEDFLSLIVFYVINTPCISLSSSGISLSSYGWDKDIWKKSDLKACLFEIASLERNKTFSVAKKTSEMKEACKKVQLLKGLQKNRDVERIAFYKCQQNEFLSILYHIRNAFAHGRFSLYLTTKQEVVFVLEDGVKKNGEFQVRSRMVLKKSTLLKWMEILQSGKLPEIHDK